MNAGLIRCTGHNWGSGIKVVDTSQVTALLLLWRQYCR